MKSQALHNLVKAIFKDEKSRKEFTANPDNFLSRFDLTDDEKKAVLNVNTKLGLVSGNSDQLAAAFDPTVIWI
ncbi:MAG: hypothetical protein A2158_00715 [Chloroflexi bacterium RBG_13_46_14]|nr:MAG: hypothetical protein A2158_00715 [Chloroflexi bacterium RBG_13_46_14]